jgi:dCMP deaminase
MIMTDKFGGLGVPDGIKPGEPEKFEFLYGGKQQKWHIRMLLAAEYFGTWSKCMSRKIGAVIVRDKTILATGYNGPPRDVPECHTEARYDQVVKILRGIKNYHSDPTTLRKLKEEWGTGCPRRLLEFVSGTGLELCPAGHSESNAVANAAREGVRITGADMYCWCPLPCMNCAKMIIGAGITRVFYRAGPDYDADSRWMLMNAGVSIIGITDEFIEKYRQAL